MKKLFGIALIVVVLLAACTPAAATEAPKPADSAGAPAAPAGEPIKVGANIGNVPWEFADKDNKFVGFELDLVNEIGKRLNRPVQIENIPFNGLFSAVESGRIDAAVSSITITQKRLKTLSFAQPYYDSDQSLTVKQGSPVAKLDDMKDKVVGVDTGSTGDMWTTANQAKYGIKEIKRYEGLAPAMLDLEAGRIDGYISDIPALLYYCKENKNCQVVERIKTNEKYSVMFAKDSPMLALFNDQITAMKKDGTLAGLHEKWFGAKADEGTSTITVVDIPKANPVIKVGANIGNVPWEFADKDNNFVGFEIELVNELGKRLDRPVEIENIPFNGLFSAVESNRIDLAVSSITITAKRLATLSFAQPYYDSDQSLTVKQGSPVAKLDDMKDKVVGVDTGSTGDMWTTENQAKYGIKEIKRYEGLAPAMLDLEAGRIDGYISDIPALLYYCKENKNCQVVERIKTSEKYSVMMAKDSPMLQSVNDAITAMKQDGTLAKLHEKWFGVKADEGTSTITVMDIPK